MRVLSLEEYKQAVEAGELAMSDAGTFMLEPSVVLGADGLDPLSAEYNEHVLLTWQWVTGRERYRPEMDEVFQLDQELYFAKPYPFSSGDPDVVAGYLGAVAETVRKVGCRPPARVIELGAGWGHLALTLAATGFEVTAIDLNPGSVALLRRRAESAGLPLDVQQGSFLEAPLGEPADAIIFYEAFHHCHRPMELLDRVTASLKVGGRLIFVAEAIYENFHVPWGIRLDGYALLMSSQAGWLELGFDRAFFHDQLNRRGFELEEQVLPHLGAHGTFLVGVKTRPG